jgi:hypothetical protein
MRRLLVALLGMLIGYPVFAFGGYFAWGYFQTTISTPASKPA